jgi:hypothetical protein
LSESAPDEVALDAGLGRRIINETLGTEVDMLKNATRTGVRSKNESTGSVISIFGKSCSHVDENDPTWGSLAWQLHLYTPVHDEESSFRDV